MTAEEYLAHGETPERTELIDGVVVQVPRPGTRHQVVLGAVLAQLSAHQGTRNAWRVFPSVDVRFGPRHVYQPDIACYAPGRVAATPTQLDVPPDLLIEILSPSTMAYDLTIKRDDYERFGVGEYWAVDPGTARVRSYVRRGELLVEAPAPHGEAVASTALPGFELNLRPLRQLAGP